jgi:hypothetical protein
MEISSLMIPMPIQAQLPDGAMAEFPDDATPQEITSAVNRNYGKNADDYSRSDSLKKSVASNPFMPPVSANAADAFNPSKVWQASNLPTIKAPQGVKDILQWNADKDNPFTGRLMKTAAGASEGLIDAGESFTSPLSVATLGMGSSIAKAPPVIRGVLGAAFAAMGAKGLTDQGSQLVDAVKKEDWGAASKLATDIAGGVAQTAIGGKEAFEALEEGDRNFDSRIAAKNPVVQPIIKGGDSNASSQQQAAEVHGDMQPQPVESARPVPTAQGSGGIQPQAEEIPPAQGDEQKSLGKVGLTPAIQVAGKIFTGDDHLDAYAKAKDGGQPDTSGSKEGFVNAQGQFLTREQAAQATGIETSKEPGKLHSSDLEVLPNVPNSIQVITPEGLRRVTVSAKMQDGKAVLNFIKIHNDKTGSYEQYPVPNNSFPTLDEAAQAGFDIVKAKFKEQKPLNPGGSRDDLSPELRAKSDAVKTAKWPGFEKIQSDIAAKKAETPIVDQPVNKPIVGMGGAVPSEFESPGTYVSNMFAAIDKERAAMGKPPMPETKARTWDADNTTALNRMNKEPEWIPNLIKEVTKSPRPLLSWENAGMVWQRAKWKAEAGNALSRIAQAYDDQRTEDLVQARTENAVLEDKLNELDTAVGRNGTGSEAGRSLQAQKMASGDDFTLTEMRLAARARNGGAPLTEKQSAEIESLHKQLADAQNQTAAAQERASKAEADATLNRIKAETASKPEFHPKIVEAAKRIVSKIDTRADAARARLKEKFARTSAGVDPTILKDLAEIGVSHLAHAALDIGEWSFKMAQELGNHWDKFKEDAKEIYEASNALLKKDTSENPLELARAMRSKSPEEQIAANSEKIGEKIKDGKKGEITWYVQRIARLMAESGIKDRDEWVDKIHDILKTHLPDLTRREAMDAISGYGDFKQLSKDQISLQVRGWKGELQQLSKLEDMAKGTPPLKSGVERRTPTEAERKLIKRVEEAKFKFQVPMTDPSTQLKSALDTLKTTLKNRITDYEDKLAREDFQKRPRRELQLDSDAMQAKAMEQAVITKYRQALARYEANNRPFWQKAMEQASGAARASALSGYHTLIKLAGYDVAKLLETPLTEAVGSGLSKLPGLKPIFEKANLESGSTLKSIRDFYVGAATKGMKEAARILRGGDAQNKLLYGKPNYQPPISLETSIRPKKCLCSLELTKCISVARTTMPSSRDLIRTTNLREPRSIRKFTTTPKRPSFRRTTSLPRQLLVCIPAWRRPIPKRAGLTLPTSQFQHW